MSDSKLSASSLTTEKVQSFLGCFKAVKVFLMVALPPRSAGHFSVPPWTDEEPMDSGMSVPPVKWTRPSRVSCLGSS